MGRTVGLQQRARMHARQALREPVLSTRSTRGQAGLHRPRDGARPVGQGEREDREQRVFRDHPHVQLGVRRVGTPVARTLPRTSCAARSTRSTHSSTTISTTAFTAPASRRARKAYEEGFLPLFAALDKVEEFFSRQRYLTGLTITEAGLASFPRRHSVRHAAPHLGHFKCNLRRIDYYPNPVQSSAQGSIRRRASPRR